MTKRILVVEDQEDNRQIIRDMLAVTDYELTEDVDDVLEALRFSMFGEILTSLRAMLSLK